MALSSISSNGLSGRQISAGGSSPNSSRITSARDVINQHSMGCIEKKKKTAHHLARANLNESVRCCQRQLRPGFQGQLISQMDAPEVVIEHVLAVLLWL